MIYIFLIPYLIIVLLFRFLEFIIETYFIYCISIVIIGIFSLILYKLIQYDKKKLKNKKKIEKQKKIKTIKHILNINTDKKLIKKKLIKDKKFQENEKKINIEKQQEKKFNEILNFCFKNNEKLSIFLEKIISNYPNKNYLYTKLKNIFINPYKWKILHYSNVTTDYNEKYYIYNFCYKTEYFYLYIKNNKVFLTNSESDAFLLSDYLLSKQNLTFIENLHKCKILNKNDLSNLIEFNPYIIDNIIGQTIKNYEKS